MKKIDSGTIITECIKISKHEKKIPNVKALNSVEFAFGEVHFRVLFHKPERNNDRFSTSFTINTSVAFLDCLSFLRGILLTF